ncbi:MAG: hypothetical protein RMK20_01670 [Verrucomicrobiales bacterium]|nr:hypothetical protein [Verrucomicrobiales bacterium]
MVSRQRLRQTLSASASAGLATLVALLQGACARWAADRPSPGPPLPREAIEAQARATFEAAVLVKPRESSSADALATGLAPLLFCEATEGANGGAGVAPQVVFYRAGAAVWGGRAFPQMTYLWRGGDGPGAALRGVRVTLDSRGLPGIWEVLDGAAGERARVVFVGELIEQRARAALGGPLPGRRFAVETDPTSSPETVVARVLDDGPALMGPEVYINASGRITGVTCRCMPPQVRRLLAMRWYELQPLPANDAEAALLMARWPEVTATLRLPPDF